MWYLYIIMLVLLSLPALADTTIERHLQKVISESFPGETLLRGFAQGPQDEEGHRYIAALSSNQYNDTRLVVLRLQPPDTLKVVAHTQQEVSIGRSVFSVGISNQSVWISVYSSGGCCSNSNTTYRFKKVTGKFLLVGVEEIYRAMEDKSPTDADTDLEKHYRLRYSANLLTNQVVHSRRSWNAFATDGEKPIGRPSYAEVTFNVGKSVSIPLQDFSLDSYSELVLTTKSLCGSLDKSMKFIPYLTCKVNGQHP